MVIEWVKSLLIMTGEKNRGITLSDLVETHTSLKLVISLIIKCSAERTVLLGITIKVGYGF